MRRGRRGIAQGNHRRSTCHKRRRNGRLVYSIDALESRILLSDLRQVADIINSVIPPPVSKPQAAININLPSAIPLANVTATLNGNGVNGTETVQFTDGSEQVITYSLSLTFTLTCTPVSLTEGGSAFNYAIDQDVGTIVFSGTAVDTGYNYTYNFNDTFNYNGPAGGAATLSYSTTSHQVTALDFDPAISPGGGQPTDVNFSENNGSPFTQATIPLPGSDSPPGGWYFDNLYGINGGSAALPLPYVTGTVYNDANGDGVQDNGEQGMPGVSVFGDFSGTGTLSAYDPVTTTDANGNYRLDLPWPATWPIREVAPTGATVTQPAAGFYSAALNSQTVSISGENFGNNGSIQLVFQQQPTDTPAGVPIAAVTVAVENGSGDVITSDNSQITLALNGGSGATLGGTLTEQAVNGVATFNNLTVNEAGTLSLQATDGNDQPATSNTFGIGPMELQGSFTNGSSSGAVEIGLAPGSGQQFQGLLQVIGTVNYNSSEISASGTFTSLVGSPQSPSFVFSGNLVIPEDSTTTSQLDVTSSNIQIAGLPTPLTSLTFGAAEMDFSGSITLPAGLGGFSLTATQDDPFILNSNGLSWQTGSVTVQNPQFLLADALEVQATQVNLSYASASQSNPNLSGELVLRGQFSITIHTEPEATQIVLDLSGNNYIGYNANAAQPISVEGSLTYSGNPIPLFSTWLSLNGLSISVNTVTQSAGGSVTIGAGEETNTFSLTVAGGYLNSIGLTLSQLNVPIVDLPGVFWQGIGGSIENLSPYSSEGLALTGELDFSYGPKLSVTLPAIVGGGTFTGSLIDTEFTGTVQLSQTGTLNEISAQATTKVVDGIATGSADLDLNFEKGTYGLSSVSYSAFNGLVSFQGSATTSAGGPLICYGTGSISIPARLIGLGGIQLASVTELVDLAASSDPTQSYFALWGTINVPILGKESLGVKVDLAGNITYLNAGNLPTVPAPATSPSSASTALRAGSTNPKPASTPASESQSFTVASGTAYILLSASWTSAAGNVPFQIIAPDGTQYTNSDSGNGKISIVPLFSGPNNLTVAIGDPLAGTWQLILPSASALGTVQFAGFASIPAPSAEFQIGVDNATTVPINYQVTDANPGAAVALFYGSSPSDLTGR